MSKSELNQRTTGTTKKRLLQGDATYYQPEWRGREIASPAVLLYASSHPVDHFTLFDCEYTNSVCTQSFPLSEDWRHGVDSILRSENATRQLAIRRAGRQIIFRFSEFVPMAANKERVRPVLMGSRQLCSRICYSPPNNSWYYHTWLLSASPRSGSGRCQSDGDK